MIFSCVCILALTGAASGQVFLDHPPRTIVAASSFADCTARFKPAELDPGYGITAIGGERAFPGEYQHMAVIGWTRSEERTEWLCGGSLITWQFVLTAAHCATDLNNIAPDTVRMGDTDLAGKEDDYVAVQVPIARFIKHPSYRASRKYYDIALVKLTERVWPSDVVCVACIWRDPNTPSTVMEAVGFGALGYAEQNSPTLQKVKLTAISTAECAERLPVNGRGSPEGLRADQFCAGSPTMDTCSGDSGGPIQLERLDLFGNLFPLIVGVVSYGTPCIGGSIGVYTRVSSYIDWIEKEVEQSLSYEVCTSVNVCNRKTDPRVTSNYHTTWPHNRFGLLWDGFDTNIYQCGAVLIDYRFLLTSAECVTSSRGLPKFVFAGGNDDRIPVKDVFVHPRYTRESLSYDIALIEVGEYANADQALPACPWNTALEGPWNVRPSFVASIPLASSYVQFFNSSRRALTLSPLDGKRCEVGAAGPTSDLYCIHRNVSLVPEVCMVDYGGPVMGKVSENEYRVYGVLSRLTKGCGSDIIFTEITPHIDWMESIIFKKLHERLVFSS